jgi:hypothetical protein
MCEDLAVAEEALAGVDRLPDRVRAERRAEYERLVEDLSAEIKETLRRAKVVPLGRPPSR